jgi:hypothetical protein
VLKKANVTPYGVIAEEAKKTCSAYIPGLDESLFNNELISSQFAGIRNNGPKIYGWDMDRNREDGLVSMEYVGPFIYAYMAAISGLRISKPLEYLTKILYIIQNSLRLLANSRTGYSTPTGTTLSKFQLEKRNMPIQLMMN